MRAPEQQSPVKEPQSRHGLGVSTVHIEPAAAWGAAGDRVYVKRQQAYYCRPLWRLFRKTPTLRREFRGIRACRRLGIPVPVVVDYREQGDRARLVLEEVRDAQPLQAALAAAGADRAAILGNVATAIGRLHRAGWCHGALYPDHLLVGPGPAYPVVFIDLEKARHSRLRRRRDLARFWRYSAGHVSAAEREGFERAYRAALTRNTRLHIRRPGGD